MQLTVDNGSSLDVDDSVFGKDFNEALVHQVVTAYMAGGRAGTKAQKSRSDVSGGGIKPWAQKGTGRARAGTIRSPIFRHGGVTFAARPRDFSQKLNQKMYRAAIRSILSELVRQERFSVVSQLELKAPKTKELVGLLKGLGSEDVLIVVDEMDSNLLLAARNLHKVEVVTMNGMTPVNLLRYKKVVCSEAVVRKIEGWLK